MEQDGFVALVDGIRQIFSDYRSAWYLGCTTLCYLFIQVLRGKAGFSIPWLTKKIESMPKEFKTYAIVGIFGLTGFLGTFAGSPVSGGALLDGFLKGLAVGIGTIGTRNVLKQGIEGVKSLKEPKVEEPK